MIKGLLVLIAFQLFGEAVAALTRAPVPGAVIGMVLLFLALQLRGQVSDNLNRTSRGFVQHLSLLFLPAGTGLFFLPPNVYQQWPAVLGAMLGGTLLSLLFSTWLAGYIARRGDGPHE